MNFALKRHVYCPDGENRRIRPIVARNEICIRWRPPVIPTGVSGGARS